MRDKNTKSGNFSINPGEIISYLESNILTKSSCSSIFSIIIKFLINPLVQFSGVPRISLFSFRLPANRVVAFLYSGADRIVTPEGD
jgi:hypothetical protein